MAWGSGRVAVWAIKHVVAPVHRVLYRATGGRLFGGGVRVQRVALLTTTGRRTGRPHTTPVFFLREGRRFVVCNVRPAGERVNPWVLNLRADPRVTLQVGREIITCLAREADGDELERYWPRLVALWPSYEDHHRRGGRRTVFVLEAVNA